MIRTGAMPHRNVALATASFLLAAALQALGASPYAWTGRSWEDPPLGDILSGADLVAEVKVLVGGQFRADARIVRVFRANPGESRAPLDVIPVEGFNSYEWNTAYYALREEESAILALFRAGRTWTLATPSSGRFHIDGARVLARFGRQEMLVEVPADDFRACLAAFCEDRPARAVSSLGELLERGALETRFVAIELLGALPPGEDRERTRILGALVREPNPVLREAAARALARVGGPDAARTLAAFVTDADRIVARAAVLAVCECGSSGATRELVGWLERIVHEEDRGAAQGRPLAKEDLDASARAFQFLASGKWLAPPEPLEREAVVRAMTEMIASGRTSRAKSAARVLGHIGAHEAVEDLLRLLDAQDPELREEAASALLAITLSPAAVSREGVSAWWREHKGTPRRRWIEEAHALAASALAERSYEGELLARMLLAISRDPLGPWAAREALVSPAGWSSAPLEEMGGPLVAAFAELALAEGSSSARSSAVRTLAELSRDLALSPERTFAREFLLASFDADADVRSEALKALGEFGGAEAVGRLLEELERGASASAKKAAAEALVRLTGRNLGYYQSKGYELEEESRGLERWREWWRDALARGWTPPRRRVPSHALAARGDGRPIEARLAEADASTWLSAAAELVGEGRTDDPRAVLEKVARFPEARLRAIAAALLGLRAEADSAPVLEALLADEEPFVRAQAVWALGRSLTGSGRAPAALVELARGGAAPAAPDAEPGAARVPPSVVGPLAPRRTSGRPGTLRSLALLALGKIGGEAALEILSSAARSDEGSLARIAAFALDGCQGKAADAALLELLSSELSGVRELAARAVSRRRPDSAAAALAKALAQAGYSESYALTEALARVARASDASVLAGLLQAAMVSPAASSSLGELGNEQAALAAAYALSLEPGPEAVGALVRALERGTSSVRYYAAKALSKLARSGALPEEARPLVSRALAARLEDFDVAVASASAAALEYAGEASAADSIFRYFRLYDPPDYRAFGAAVRLGGRKGLELALSQAKDGTWGAKYFAISALRHSPSAEAVKLLVETWRDPESPYREVASRSLAALGPRATGPLVEVLRKGAPFERRRAARLLGEIGGDVAREALREAAAGPDQALAAVARLALAGSP